MYDVALVDVAASPHASKFQDLLMDARHVVQGDAIDNLCEQELL